LGRRRLRLHERIFFGTGHVINVLAVSMWFPYNVTFFQKVLLLPPKDTGTIILIAQAVGAVCTPFVGLWSDQTRCRYPGRRKIRDCTVRGRAHKRQQLILLHQYPGFIDLHRTFFGTICELYVMLALGNSSQICNKNGLMDSCPSSV